jgi:hypothetical protein
LDKAIEELKKKKDKELKEIENIFIRAINFCYNIFGNSAFAKNNKQKNSCLFEIWMVSVAKLSDSDNKILVDKRSLVIDKLKEMINDKAFSDSISVSTQKKEHFRIRYDRINSLIKEVLNA